MTMVPTKERHGLSGAKVTCDECGAVVSIRCDHMGSRGRPGEAPPRIETGHAVRKLNSMGWRASATRQTCKTCVATKPVKPKKEEPEMVPITTTKSMTPIHVDGVKLDPAPDVPKPSLAQRQEINLMFLEVYDIKAKRYKGEETDKSVAHALGIERWGWVSTIREDFFGPAGNEAAELLMAEVKAKIAAADLVIQATEDQIKITSKHLNEAKTTRDELAALLARVKGTK